MNDRQETHLAEPQDVLYAPPPTRAEVSLPLRGWSRWLAMAISLLGLASLSLAGWLSPDPRGLGTHEQLGLPPCLWRFLHPAGCPSCGLTTAWAHGIRGQFAASWHANPGGLPSLISVAIASIWLGVSSALGRWWGKKLTANMALLMLMISVGFTLVGWFFRLQ